MDEEERFKGFLGLWISGLRYHLCVSLNLFKKFK